MPSFHRTLLLAALAAPACDSPPPETEPVMLVAAADTIFIPHLEITQAAWIDDDHWVMIAPNEPAVLLADFSEGTATQFGTADAFQQPFSVFRSGDSLFVGDWARAQLTVWSLDGQLVDSIPASGAVAGHLPRARDGAGRFYVQRNPSPGPDGSGLLDSSWVVRGPADFATVDTVAQLAPRDVVEVSGQAGKRFEPRLLSGSDEWGAALDGSVWVVRVDQNRVEWRSPEGEWNRGPGLPDPVLTVEEGDRQLFLREFPEELRRNATQIPFAIVKPPFTAVVTDPDGELWIRKTAAYLDSTRLVQEVGRDGRLARQFRFPGYGQLMAAGRESILVVETWSQGVRVLRYELIPDLTPHPPS
ncbi:MAG: hypothetical protein ACREL6_01065, partial [Gemmatimonadales bacterium]